MSTEALSARDLTNQLVARAALSEPAPERAAHAACELAFQHLSRSLGVIGFHGLYTRALAQAQAEHPLLRELRLERGSVTIMPAITDVVETYGALPVADALCATLATLFELLARLVGMDVVVRLVVRTSPAGIQEAKDAP